MIDLVKWLSARDKLPEGLSWRNGLAKPLAHFADWASNHADFRNLDFAPEAEGLRLSDLHSDTLLWGVDPWAQRETGHMDIPRLQAAKMRFQIFAAPSWTPLPGRNAESELCVSCEGFDQSNALFPAQIMDFWRTKRTHNKRLRAFLIARRFHKMIAKADEQEDVDLVPIFKSSDFDRLSTEGTLGVMLSLEGLHWLNSDDTMAAIEHEIAGLKVAGFRMIAPTHRFSNALGGSNEDCTHQGGLSTAGRRVLQACFNQSVAVDLAHASRALIREACGLALNHADGIKPIIVSHTGLYDVHPVERNITAEDIRAVVSTGGLIGVGLWRGAMGWQDDEPFESKIAYIVRSFTQALDTLSEKFFVQEMEARFGHYDPYAHLAFGSDFDGAVTTPFDVTGVSHVVAALSHAQRDGHAIFPKDKLALIAGENAIRILKAVI